jgi:hypothetical protein
MTTREDHTASGFPDIEYEEDGAPVLDIDTRSGYDVSEPYHARLVAIAKVAEQLGITARPSFYLEVVYPKVAFDLGGPSDLTLAFGSTAYDDDYVEGDPDLTWWNAWGQHPVADDAPLGTDGAWYDHIGDPVETPEAAVNAAIVYLVEKRLVERHEGKVRIVTADCSCGHPVAEHQTGTGPWTGFCADTDCKCESPAKA